MCFGIPVPIFWVRQWNDIMVDIYVTGLQWTMVSTMICGPKEGACRSSHSQISVVKAAVANCFAHGKYMNKN